jgi:hypothetical protein
MLHISSNNVLYLAASGYSTSKLKIKKLVSGSWVNIGSQDDLTNDAISYPAIVTDNNGNVFTAFTSDGNGTFVKTYGSFSTLPVTLLKFEVNADADSKAYISWSTGSETNSSHFLVQRSDNGKDFYNLKELKSMGSNSDYHLVDDRPNNGRSYYKLVQLDKDGKSTDLGIKELTCLKKNNSEIFPQPLTSSIFHVNLRYSSTKGAQEIKVYDLYGRKVGTYSGIIRDNVLSVDLGSKLQKGVYIVNIKDEPPLKLIVE